MWPFKSIPRVEETALQFTKVQGEFPIGRKVRYLGLDMQVVSHHKYMMDCDPIAGVWLEYVDVNLEIKSKFIADFQFALIRGDRHIPSQGQGG